MVRIRKGRVPFSKPYERLALDHQEAGQVVNGSAVAAWELRRRKAEIQNRKSGAEQQRVNELYKFDDTRPPLGSGAQGLVSLCPVKETGDAVVCKVVTSNILHEARQEVAIHRKCSSHPLVATFLDAMEFNDTMYIVMEHCAGGTLHDLIGEYYGHPQEGTSSMPHELAAHVMKQLAQVMTYIHRKGVVHRDIKGDNVMMMSDRRSIRLVDFGLAEETDPGCQDSAEGATMIRRYCAGTSGFIAPEALRNEDAGTAVDAWSAGVLLYLMLTGKMPFRNLQSKELARRDCLKEVDFSHTNLTKQAKDLVLRMLDFNPGTRIGAPEIQDHPWIIETLAAATPCKKQHQLSHLQDLLVIMQSLEDEQKQCSTSVSIKLERGTSISLRRSRLPGI